MEEHLSLIWHDYSLETLVVVVEEFLEVQYLPARLTREVVRQSLELVQHDIVYVIVVEDRVE